MCFCGGSAWRASSRVRPFSFEAFGQNAPVPERRAPWHAAMLLGLSSSKCSRPVLTGTHSHIVCGIKERCSNSKEHEKSCCFASLGRVYFMHALRCPAFLELLGQPVRAAGLSSSEPWELCGRPGATKTKTSHSSHSSSVLLMERGLSDPKSCSTVRRLGPV